MAATAPVKKKKKKVVVPAPTPEEDLEEEDLEDDEDQEEEDDEADDDEETEEEDTEKVEEAVKDEKAEHDAIMANMEALQNNGVFRYELLTTTNKIATELQVLNYQLMKLSGGDDGKKGK